MRLFPLAPLFAVFAPAASAQFGDITPLFVGSRTTFGELADVDADGIPDLLTIEADAVPGQLSIRWSKGSLDSLFGPSMPIRTIVGAISPFAMESQIVDAGDVDGDGFVDLFAATNEGLVWLPGQAGQQFGAPRIVDQAPCGDVQLLDLDHDGDPDVVRGSFSGGPGPDNLIYRNDGGGALTPLQVGGTCCYYGTPRFTDADLDGDLDLVTVTDSPLQTKYFENLGGLSFAPPVVIAALPGSPYIGFADVDLDGDEDLLYAHFAQAPGGWVENTSGLFTTNQVVAGLTVSLSAPRAGDVDGDGDIDLVFVQDLFGTSWYPNDGSNQFPQQIPVDLPLTHISALALIDVDGDRSLDVLVQGDNPRGISYYPNVSNLGADTCTANPNSTGSPATLRASGSRSVAANQFALTLGDAPPGQFAAYLVGRVAQTSPLPGSAGVLCLGSPFGIFRGLGQVGQIDASGTRRLPIDLRAIPVAAGFQAVQSGETWYFQSIFRDPSPFGASNLSPAIEVTFVL